MQTLPTEKDQLKSNFADLDQVNPDRVDELQSSWRGQSLSENTRNSYRSDIKDFNRYLEETNQNVSGQAVKSYLDKLEEESSPATLNRKRYAILKVLKTYGEGFAPLINAIEENVKSNTKTYETEKAVDGDLIPTKDEVTDMVETAREESRERLSLIIKFLWRTGLRVSEALNIKPDRDVTINGRAKIRIRGKGNKERTVKVPREFYEQITGQFDGNTYLFETTGGNKYNRSNLYRQLNRLGKRMGVIHATNPHIFRHARATWMLENGFSLKSVSNFLGHSTTSITADIYQHATLDWDRLERLDQE